MKAHIKTYILKSLLLASVIILMLLLCGCRTRITNNTEVADVISDEGGWLSQSYQVRRDELGIPVAEPPLFMGFGSGDEDYGDDYDDYDYDYDGFDQSGDEDFDDEEDEDIDEDDEADEDSQTQDRPSGTATRPSSGTATRPSTTTRRPATPVRRVVKRPAATQTTAVKVTLNLNASDAKCSRSTVTVKKGSTYGSLPTPTRSGYSFDGWYTSKTGGSKVTSKTKVSTDKAHTIYAHWTENAKAKYTVTFDGNGEGDEVTLSSSEMTVEEGGTYGDMPSAKRDKYKFSGWFTDPTGGSQVTGKAKIAANKDHTLYAHWEFDPYTWWDNEFSTAANGIGSDAQPDCVVEDGDSTEEGIVKDCKGRIAEDDSTAPAYIVRFTKNFDKMDDEALAEAAGAIYDKYAETSPDAKVIMISDMAAKGSKEEKLLYKMMLMEIMYGSGGNIDEAADDLLDEGTSVSYPYVYPAE